MKEEKEELKTLSKAMRIVFAHIRSESKAGKFPFTSVIRTLSLSNSSRIKEIVDGKANMSYTFIYRLKNIYNINPNFLFDLSAPMLLAPQVENNENDLEPMKTDEKIKKQYLKDGFVSLRKNPEKIAAFEVMTGERVSDILNKTNKDVLVLFDKDDDVLDWKVFEN